MVSGKPLTFQIGTAQSGQRLDKALAGITGYGRKRLRELFEARCVHIAGRSQPGHWPARAGDSVEILPLPRSTTGTTHPLQTVLETPHLVIVEKPAGQATVPLPGRTGNSVAELLVERFPEMQSIGYRPSEAGLLHRLDTQTSGLLLAARDRATFVRLQTALQQGQIEKHYYAVVPNGIQIEQQVLDWPLMPHPKSSRRVAVCQPGHGKLAHTNVHLERRGVNFTLLDVRVAHAYRHQIRVHLSHLGFPLLGDTLYGGQTLPQLGERHALHAAGIAFAGDEQLPPFSSHSELPSVFAELLDAEAPA